MYRETGAGKILEGYEAGGALKALLYNFDFDDFDAHHALKPAHADFLLFHVLPLLAQNRGQVWLVGSASRIGDFNYNLELSKVRNNRVAEFLTSRGVHADQVQANAIGESEAAGHALDLESDRSVEVHVRPNWVDLPRPPPRLIPRRPPISREFKLAMLTGLSASHAMKFAKFRKLKVGAGFAVDGDLFTMWDTTNNIACIYVYVGLGIGVGFSALPSAAFTTHGPWNSFTTEKNMGVWQFGRWARFTTAGVADWTVNWITIETPKGIDNVYESIDTGTTYGAGGSSTIGDFIRLEGPDAFNGP